MADYEIPVISDGDHVVDMLNAVKLMTQLTDGTTSGQFNSILATVGMVGLIIILINLVLRGNLQSLLHFLIAYALVFGVLFVPKVDVIVNDRSDPTVATNPVENVPLGVGVLAWITTSFGDKVATSLETIMSPVDAVSYQGGNMLWGQKVMTEMPGMRFTSARVADNMNKYLRSCVFPTIAADPEEMQTIKQSTDLWAHLASNAPNTRITEYTTTSGTTSFLSCKAASLLITPELSQEAQDAMTFYGQRLYPDKDGTDAATALKDDLGTLHNTFIGVSRDGGEMLKQVMMLNQFEAGLQGYASDSASASLMNFVNSRAETQARLTMSGLGSLMQTGVPRLYTLLFVILIALFPFIIAIGLLPGIGFSVVKNYAFGFVYLQAFPVLFIIINRIIVVENSSLSTAAAKNVTGSGISFQNMGILSEIPSETSAMAAVMLALIPVLAGIFTKGIATLGGQMENILRPMQVATESAAQEASTGNIAVQAANINTSQMDSASAYQVQKSPSVDATRSRYRSDNGSWIGQMSNGKIHVDSTEARSNLMMKPDVRESALQQISANRSSALREEETASEAYTEATEQTRARSMGLALATGMGADLSETVGLSQSRDVTSALESSRQELARFAEDNNVSFEDLGRAYGKISGGVGQDTGIIESVVGSNAFVQAEAGAEGSIQARHAENLVKGEEFQRILRSSQNLADVESALSGVNESERFSKSNEFTEGLNDSLNRSQTAQSTKAAASARVEQLDNMESRIRSNDSAVNADLSQAVVEKLIERHGEERGVEIAQETSLNPYALTEQRAAAEAVIDDYTSGVIGGELVQRGAVLNAPQSVTDGVSYDGRAAAGFGGNREAYLDQATAPIDLTGSADIVDRGQDRIEGGYERTYGGTVDGGARGAVGLDQYANPDADIASPEDIAASRSDVINKPTRAHGAVDLFSEDPAERAAREDRGETRGQEFGRKAGAALIANPATRGIGAALLQKNASDRLETPNNGFGGEASLPLPAHSHVN